MASVRYELDPERPTLGTPVMVHGLTGFMDAGGASRLAVEHILDTCEHTRVATFDIDALYDYRDRRPRTVFDSDHYRSVQMPEFVVDAATDSQGEQFLLLHGSEPDLAWGAMAESVLALTEELRVRLVVGLHAIPWPAPHTRPVFVTTHANDPSLLGGNVPWVGAVDVPGSLAALIELRLGERSRPAMGFAAHVPEYLMHKQFPRGALVLLQSLGSATGLSVPMDDLRDAADETDADYSLQIAANPENLEKITALEAQYDSLMSERGQPGDFGAIDLDADIAAQVEAFLAEQDPGDQES